MHYALPSYVVGIDMCYVLCILSEWLHRTKSRKRANASRKPRLFLGSDLASIKALSIAGKLMAFLIAGLAA